MEHVIEDEWFECDNGGCSEVIEHRSEHSIEEGRVCALVARLGTVVEIADHNCFRGRREGRTLAKYESR